MGGSRVGQNLRAPEMKFPPMQYCVLHVIGETTVSSGNMLYYMYDLYCLFEVEQEISEEVPSKLMALITNKIIIITKDQLFLVWQEGKIFPVRELCRGYDIVLKKCEGRLFIRFWYKISV